MITCLRCGRVNDGRYRFCLGCGAALPQQKNEEASPSAAPPPPGPPPPGSPPVAIELPVRTTPSTPAPPAIAPPIAAPAPSFSARVPKRSHDDNDNVETMALEPVMATPPGTARPADPMDVAIRHTAQPREMPAGPRGTNLRGGPQGQGEPAAATAPASDCTKCGSPIADGHVFCGVCGNSVAPPAAAPAPRASRSRAADVGHLALIDDLGSESVRYSLIGGSNMIGRAESSDVPFPQDGLLAAQHCVIDAAETPFRLTPVDFCNGTYLRISTPVELQHGDIVRVGQEVLRFERIEDVEQETNPLSGQPSAVGCPMPRGVWGRLCQIGMARQVANAYLLSHRDVFLGRERGDILFPKDGFVSGSHAVISERGGRVYLKDLGSSNGTFLRIKQEIALRNGDLLLLGRNLLRVHVGA